MLSDALLSIRIKRVWRKNERIIERVYALHGPRRFRDFHFSDARIAGFRPRNRREQLTEAETRSREFLHGQSRACIARGDGEGRRARETLDGIPRVRRLRAGNRRGSCARAAIEKEIGFHSNLHGVCMALMRMHARGEPSISAPSRSCEPSPPPPAVTVSRPSRSETPGVAFIRHSVSAIASLKMGVPLTERILESRYVRGYYHSTFIGGRKHFRVIRPLLIADADDRAASRISLECCTIELILCAKKRYCGEKREGERGGEREGGRERSTGPEMMQML
jgi:hypothetical protein